MLKEPVSYNTGLWNPKNFYGLVQQKGPWPNQAIDNEKRKTQPLPAGVVGKGGTLHAGHNYWNLDTTFMSDIHTLGDTGSLKYHTAPAINTGKPFVGGGVRKKGYKQTFLDPNTLKHFAQLAEFLGKYPGDGEPKDADLNRGRVTQTSQVPGAQNIEPSNYSPSTPYLSPRELDIPGLSPSTATFNSVRSSSNYSASAGTFEGVSPTQSSVSTNIPLTPSPISSTREGAPGLHPAHLDQTPPVVILRPTENNLNRHPYIMLQGVDDTTTIIPQVLIDSEQGVTPGIEPRIRNHNNLTINTSPETIAPFIPRIRNIEHATQVRLRENRIQRGLDNYGTNYGFDFPTTSRVFTNRVPQVPIVATHGNLNYETINVNVNEDGSISQSPSVEVVDAPPQRRQGGVAPFNINAFPTGLPIRITRSQPRSSYRLSPQEGDPSPETARRMLEERLRGASGVNTPVNSPVNSPVRQGVITPTEFLPRAQQTSPLPLYERPPDYEAPFFNTPIIVTDGNIVDARTTTPSPTSSGDVYVPPRSVAREYTGPAVSGNTRSQRGRRRRSN